MIATIGVVVGSWFFLISGVLTVLSRCGVRARDHR